MAQRLLTSPLLPLPELGLRINGNNLAAACSEVLLRLSHNRPRFAAASHSLLLVFDELFAATWSQKLWQCPQ